MANSFPNGHALTMTMSDFNERAKRIAASTPQVEKAPERRRNAPRRTPEAQRRTEEPAAQETAQEAGQVAFARGREVRQLGAMDHHEVDL